MIFVALEEAARKRELILVDGGMCRFHKRRDGVVVIREIIVLPACRLVGIGRAMIDQIGAKHPDAILRATCPAAYDANQFWAALGFVHVETKSNGKLLVWECPP